MSLEENRIEGTNRDNTVGMKYEESMIGGIVVAAAATMLGVAAYKTGHGKKAISKFISKASKGSNNGKVSFARSLRKWALNENKDSASYFTKLIEKDIKKGSLGKLKTAGGRKDLFDEVKELFSDSISDRRIDATVNDIKRLEKDIKKSSKHLESLSDSNLSRDIREINNISKNLKIDNKYTREERNTIRNKLFEDLIESNKLTNKKKAIDMKRKGYTSLTLGDLFNVEEGRKGLKLVENQSATNLFSKKDLDGLKSLLNNSYYKNSKGKTSSLLSHKDIGKLKVDNSILFNGEEVADLRAFKNIAKDISHSLAKDFKIPVIGINPFSIIGLHEFGKRNTSFALLKSGTRQSAITGSSNFTDTDMFFSKGSIYKLKGNTMEKVKDKTKAIKVHANSNTESRQLEATRKMHGTNKIEYNEYSKKDGTIANAYGRLGKWLDLGFDDIDVNTLDEIGALELLNPNAWIAKGTNKLKKTGFLRPNKGTKIIDDKTGRTEKTVMEMFSNMDSLKSPDDGIFVAINESYNLIDMIKDINKADADNQAKEAYTAVKKYISQFTAGRKNLDKITEKTTYAHFLADRVSSTLGVGGFGLSSSSLGSPTDVVKNLLLKRALPLYVGYNAVQFGIMMTEGEPDELGNRDNILKKAAKSVAYADLAMHKGLEIFGISSFTKGLTEALPGIDQITELPVLSSLGLDQNFEERLDHITNGYNPIRKNRFWDGGNQAMTGSKIEYFKPTLYRRIMADADFSDTKWGSRKEYFMNAPFPNPLNPLAPIKHFITDPYHYDKKHMEDRPYAVTAPMFQNIPFLGSILSPTLGELIKPTKYTHPHIFNDKGLEDSSNSGLSIGTNAALMFSTGGLDYGDGEDDVSGLSLAPMLNISSGGSVALTGSFSSDSGKIYEGIKGGSTLSSMSSSDISISYGNNAFDMSSRLTTDTQNGISYNSRQLMEDAGNFFGLYGFMTTTVTGEPLDGQKYVENASYANSASRMFYDNAIGGLGGDTNEIARRFLRKRMKDDSLINPIANSMPDWMPGAGAMINFKFGDPYVRIASGELRLPGQAYERLHDIKSFDLYGIDAGQLTSVDAATRATINKHTTYGEDTLKKEVMDIFRNNDRVVEQGGEISDYDRNIKAKYDSIINIGNDTGMLFVNTPGNDESTMTRANVAMYLTGDTFAFIQSVDDKGNRAGFKKIEYNKEVVDNAMDVMTKARSNIKHQMDIGQMSNGDLYSPIDKLRILADTAPYSDEYMKMKSVVAMSDLSEEEREEVGKINDRVTEVRKPLRLYDYEFLGRSTTKDKKVVASIIDNETFTVFGDNAVYKLAGINIAKQEDQILNNDLNEILESYLHVGSAITVEFDANPALRYKGGANRVIVNKGGKSLQEELLDRGLATKNTSDDPIDKRVKTNILQKAIGAAWESFAHADTPIHSKLLRVRSAKEDYERSRVYGKQFSSWKNPISDYLIPLVFDRNVGRGTIDGIVMGTTIGAMFGKTKYGTLVGAALGFTAITVGKAYTGIKEEITGRTWKPKRVEKEQALYDYMDKLKYVKYRKLYHEYADKAKKDNVDVRKMIGASKKLKSQTRVKKKWMSDYNVTQGKLNQVLKIPNWILRLHPRADLNISGIISHELPNAILSFKSKIIKSSKDINNYIKKIGVKKDNSKANINNETLSGALSNTWGSDTLEEESNKIQKQYIASKMNNIKNKRLILPLRGNLKHDRKAPPAKELDKLIQAKVLLTNSKSSGETDSRLRKEIRGAGVVPVYRGALKSRTMDKDRTMARLDIAISKMAIKAGFSEDAAKAMEYYKMSESTMYAYDRGESISDVASAMEKRDRDYFREFISAKDSEKLEILDLIPKYMRRPLEAAWGLQVENKDDLVEYFSKHSLPGQEWSGWGEDVDLNNVKVKIAKNEQIEFSDSNIWGSDVEAANRAGEIAIPLLNYKDSGANVRYKLAGIMGRMGYNDVTYSSRSNGTSDDVSLYLKYNKKSEYAKELEGKFASNI